MSSKTIRKFIEEAEGYLPIIRGGILLHGSEGKLAEIENSRRYLQKIKESAAALGLEELAIAAQNLEQDLKVICTEKPAVSAQNSRNLLDKLIELEALLAKISFSTDDFSLDIADFVEESFGNLQLPDLTEDIFTEDKENKAREEDDFEIDDEMVEVFTLEAEDLLRNISANLETLEKTPNNREALLEIRRNAHTLKGSAGIVGLKQLSNLAHRVEDLLDYLAENKIEGNEKIFELLLASTDCFEALARGENSTQLIKKIPRLYKSFDEMMAMLQGKTEQPSAAFSPEKKNSISAELKESPENQLPSTQPQNRSLFRVSIEKLDDLVKLVSEMVINRSVFEQRLLELDRQIEELSNTTRRLQRSTGKLETDFEGDFFGSPSLYQPALNLPLRQIGNFGDKDEFQEFDTLEFDRYTEFHQITRELIETTADTSSIYSELDTLRSNLESLFHSQRRLLEEMQDKLLHLRMVTFGSLSVRLARTVRVTCEQENKLAELTIEGESLEIDTQILDSLVEPLLHLLRNAVAHGIESPDIRRLLGKPEKGKIHLRAVSEGTHIVISVSDDGRGILVSELKEKAVSQALISREKALQMSEEETFSLAFLPGLTTAEEISQTAGRGVGMNIVQTGIMRQQGTISIISEQQKGTTFIIRLPMSLAVTRGLLIKSNGQTFAFPLKIIKQVSEISAAELTGKKSILLENKDYAVSYLSELLSLPATSVSSKRNTPLLLIETLENPRALVVDEILKTEEIVIKPLGTPLQNLAQFVGATILGNGKVVPVLDLIYLLKNKVQSSEFRVQSPGINNEPKPQIPNSKPQAPNSELTKVVMIVDDSPSVRHLTSKIILKAGWQAVIAKDGLEALELLQSVKKQPDIILTDVEMPRMDGYELLATLKKQVTLRDIPVVMITSRASEKHRQKAVDLGVSEYLTKPFEDSKLIEIIKRLGLKS